MNIWKSGNWWRRLGAAVFLFCVTGCVDIHPTAEQALPRAIILISVDTLRPDHLGTYGYSLNTSPFIDHLATTATVFENAVSTSSWTLPAHVSLMVSRGAADHGVHTPNERLRSGTATLARSLRSAGYRTGGFYSSPLLSDAYGLEQGFDHYVQPAIENDGSPGAAVNQMALEWIDSAEEPFFLFLHYYDVHAPYRQRRPDQRSFADQDEGSVSDYLEMVGTVANRFLVRHGVETSGLDWRFPKTGFGRAKQRLQEAAGGTELQDELLQHKLLNRGLTETEQRRVIAFYDDGVASLDYLLGQLASGLEQRGLFGDALIWIVSDHGEMLYDHHGYRDHTYFLNQSVTAIPMIVRLPNQVEPQRVSRPVVSLIDVAPSILDLAGLDPTGQGISLRGLLQGAGEPAERPLSIQLGFDGSFKRAVLHWPWKLIVDDSGRDGARLYNLVSDPEERHDVVEHHGEIYSKLTQELRDGTDGTGELAESRIVGREESEALRALGYIR